MWAAFDSKRQIVGLTIAAFLAVTIMFSPTPAMTASRCAAEAGLKSSGGNIVSEIKFVNLSDFKRHIYWIDYEGNRDLGSGGPIPAGDFLEIEPYVGHVFVATDSNDNCIDVYFIGGQSQTITFK